MLELWLLQKGTKMVHLLVHAKEKNAYASTLLCFLGQVFYVPCIFWQSEIFHILMIDELSYFCFLYHFNKFISYFITKFNEENRLFGSLKVYSRLTQRENKG